MKMMFASKAFMTKAICKIMQQEGFGLDLCSGGEIYTANSAGFDMSKTLFNGNNKTRKEIGKIPSVRNSEEDSEYYGEKQI